MEEKTKTTPVHSHFLALYCMVVADGIIDIHELETLYKIGREQYGLTQDQINQSILQNGTSFVVPENIEAKIQFLYNLATIAWADGILEKSEIELMNKYVVRMGFLEENSSSIANFIFDCVREGKTVEETIEIAKQ